MPKAGEVVAFRTGQIWELDMVEAALGEAGIPCYRLRDVLGIGELTMDALPAMGPGVQFLIVVHESAKDAARKVIEALPISQQSEEGLWAFRPTERVKRGWRLYAVMYLCIVVVTMILWTFYSFVTSIH